MLLLPGGGHGHCPALGEPWAGKYVVGAPTRLRTDPEVSLPPGQRVTLVVPRAQPRASHWLFQFRALPHTRLLQRHTSKFGAKNMKTESGAAFSHPC